MRLTLLISRLFNFCNTEESIAETYDNVKEYLFDQSLTHQKTNNQTFGQKYFVDDTQLNLETDSPVAILYIGGEGPLNAGGITGFSFDLAQKFGALIVGLEHRYYGQSHPFETLNYQTLKYLNVDMALKDIRNFINFMNYKLKKKARWLVVGGSYAGNLAAWAKASYPNLIHSAYASSAPIFPKNDFYEYDLMVSKVIGKQCTFYFNKFVTYLDKLIVKKKPLSPIKKLFGCYEIQDDLFFSYTVSDFLASVVQYNKNPKTPITVTEFCEAIEENQEIKNVNMELLTKKISEYFNHYLNHKKKSCIEYTEIKNLQTETIQSDSSIKQWTYQTCTELGYWQTTPPKQFISTRSKFLTLNWYLKNFCTKYYFGKDLGPALTNKINNKSKKIFRTSNILFTNGENDPWSYLSVKQSTSLKRPSFIIKFGSHVNDLAAETPHDSIYLRKVREKVSKVLSVWFKKS